MSDVHHNINGDCRLIGCPECKARTDKFIIAPLFSHDECQAKYAAIEEKLRVAVEANEILSDVCKAYLQRVSYDWRTRFIEALDKAELNGGSE